MANLIRNRSSGRQRLRQGYVGKQFQLEGRQYVVEDVIAEGGFAVVLDVRCTSGNNERLALKRVAVNNEHDLFLCRQEIAIMRALSDSPNSVTYLASQINRIGRDVYEVLILMQLYGGQSALQMLRQHHSQNKNIPESSVLKIFTDVCQSVARLHHRTKPITHRDLKVENILQDFSGNFILCDFGSCTTKIMNPKEDGVPQCEDQIQRFTTLAYRAPEMVDLYSGHVIGIKSDIWALGCLLYKLCFFETPFGEQSLAIMRGTFSFPTTSAYSPCLHKLIRDILNPHPEERLDIYQVSHLAHMLLGKENPVPNVFNSPVPVLPVSPTIPEHEQGKKRTGLEVPNKGTGGCSPIPNKPLTPLSSPAITTTSISSRERPRPRPLSSIGPPPPNSTSQSENIKSGSPYLKSRPSSHSPSMTSNPSVSNRRQHSQSQYSTTNNTRPTKSTDSSLKYEPRPSPRIGVSQPLPPPVTDIFGHTPFSENDLFGSSPFNSAVKQVT